MQVRFTVTELTQIVQPLSVRGTGAPDVTSIASLDQAQPGDLSFLGNPKYKAQVAATKASVVLLPADFEGEPAEGQQFLLVKNPSASLALLCSRIEQSLWPKATPGIHPSAVVSPTAKVAASATVGPLCVIEDGVVIGERTHLQAQIFVGRDASIGSDCWFSPGVRLGGHCTVGNRVRLHSGVVIGADGFGYEFVAGRHEKVPQVGIVEIHDDVEVGANSTMDRARFSRTVVGQGTKIDNLVQIGHNCILGKHVILCAQVGLAGTTTIEDYVVLAGQVGVGGHLTIGRGSRAGGQAGIHASLPAGSNVTGTPMLSFQRDRRINILRERLPELFRRVDTMEKQLGITPPPREKPAEGAS